MKTAILLAILMLTITACQSTTTEQQKPADVTFTLTGQNFKFLQDGQDSPTLRVKQGQTVKIEFSSTDGYHDWVLDEFNAATNRVNPEDGTTTVTFTADKKGTFEYYCSVGSHRANGMYGTFIVE